MESYLRKKIIGKEIEVYYGAGEDIYSGKAVEADHGVLVLEVDGNHVFLNTALIQAFWIAENRPHLQTVK